MELKYEIKLNFENGEFRGSHGATEIDYEKIKRIENICKERKYKLSDIIEFLIENIDEESINQIIETMET